MLPALEIERTEARSQVTDKVPELWHADTGRATAVSYRFGGGRTVVPLDLAAGEAVFVIFRKTDTANAATVAASVASTVERVDGPSTVTFQPGRGAPATLRVQTPAPLGSRTDPRIRYFSGVVTCTADVSYRRSRGS